MSASIIQKKVAFAQHTGSGSVAVTLDNPIGAGSIVVIACAVVQSDGSQGAAPAIAVVDDLTNNYAPTRYNSSGQGFFGNCYQDAITPQTGARTYILNYTAQVGGSGYSYLAGIAIYEVSGASASATNETASQALSGFHKMSDLSAAISGLSGGTYGNLLVSIGAFAFTSLSDAQAVAAGSGWTLDGRDGVSGTFNPMAIVFESQLVGPASNPAAVFSGSANNTELDGTILVAAYSLTSAIAGGSTPSDTDVFLGSIRVVSAPNGVSVPFIGTVKVVNAVPSGRANPYLGKIVIGTPGPSNNNPVLGEVVVVEAAPTNVPDIFFGTVQES